MLELHPYLIFDGNCREAMKFYQNCIGGELNLQTVGESPAAEHMPASARDLIMHSTLSWHGTTLFFASDMMGRDPLRHGNALAVTLIYKDPQPMAATLDKLVAGGKVDHALKQEFFGTYGDLHDQYGVRWMFQSDMKTK